MTHFECWTIHSLKQFRFKRHENLHVSYSSGIGLSYGMHCTLLEVRMYFNVPYLRDRLTIMVSVSYAYMSFPIVIRQDTRCTCKV